MCFTATMFATHGDRQYKMVGSFHLYINFPRDLGKNLNFFQNGLYFETVFFQHFFQNINTFFKASTNLSKQTVASKLHLAKITMRC